MWGALATYLLAVFLIPYRGVPLHRALWDHGPEILGLPRPLAYVGGLAGIYIVCLGASILVSRLMKKDDPRWTELSSRTTRPGINVEDLVLGALAAVVVVYAVQTGIPLYGVLAMAVPTITTVLTQLFQSRGKATTQDAPKTEVDARD